MSPKLEVYWDGVNRGDGSDLLCCPALGRLPADIDAVTPRSRVQQRFSEAAKHAQACRAAVLVCLSHGALSAASLEAVTGFSKADIVAAILYLRKYATVEAEVIPVAARTQRGTWKTYRLAAGDGESSWKKRCGDETTRGQKQVRR